MKEKSEQDGQASDVPRAKWKRRLERVARVLGLFHVSLLLLVFLLILRTGYLSWIGIMCGVLYLLPGLAAPFAGFAGKRRPETGLSVLSTSEPLLVALVIGIVSIWPEREDGSWRPYSFDRELAAIEAGRAVPEEENAALRYDTVLTGVDVNDRSVFVSRAGRADRGLREAPWKSEDCPEAARWLDLRVDIIGKLMQIGAMENCRWPVYANSNCRWTVPYRKVSYAIWLLEVATQRDLGEGRSQQALEKCLCLLRIADHLYQQTHDVDFRTAFHCERAALQMLRCLLVEGKLSPQNLETIAQRLPTAADTWQQDTARLLAFDEFRFAQFLASIYEISGEGKVRFAASCRWLDEGKQEQEDFFLRSRIWRLYWLMNMPRRPERVWDMAHKESAALGLFLQQGPASCAAHAKDLRSPSFFDSVGKALGNVARCGAHELCLSEFLYACFAESYAGQMTERRATWLVLGLRRYRDTYGAWPQTLDAISEYVPAEAFLDPTNGGAFVYTLDGDSFKLYSKGPNRVDEGARHGYVKALDKIEDDIPIWPPPVPEPKDKLTDDELLKQMKEIYGPNYVETYMKDKGSDKR